MTKERIDEIFNSVEGFSNAYEEPKEKNSEFEDDCFIHITRKGFRIVFYNGQDDGAYTANDVNRFAEIVDSKFRAMKPGRKKNS